MNDATDTDIETCESCGCTDATCELQPACDFCGMIQCTICANEYGQCCGEIT